MDRLPRGRHGLPREFVAKNQRDRLLAGLTEVLYEVGYRKTTVSLIGRRASVSKSDFYKHFESKDDCFCAAYDAAISRIGGEVDEACSRSGGAWPERVREALTALLTALADDPRSASLILIEGLRAGPIVYGRYQQGLEGMVRRLRDGAPAAPEGDPVPQASEEAIVGGIASLLGRRVLERESEEMPALLPQLLEFVLTPYLGTGEARRIVSAG